ncbi:MAG: DMT family transporter [Candidatus Kerfeldbacteria bacterium]|nr:DMT family transporter [Candidatus Kerfeldbacteria bacterium]
MNRERQGELFILLQTPLWGLFPIITILTLNRLSPLISLVWSTLFSCIFFAVVVSLKKKWRDLTNIAALKDVLWNVFFVGILYYVLFFYGLQHTSAGNAGIIALTEVFFSFVFFHLWRRHFIPRVHILGALLVLLGAVIVLFPTFTHFQIGDIFILVGVFFAPFGNFFNQRARKRISSEAIMFIRSALSAPLLFAIAFMLGERNLTSKLYESVTYLAINGIFLLGLSKLFWIEGIHRISVTKANALASISPLLTLLFAWLILHNIPTAWQLLSLVPMVVGIKLLSTREPKNVPTAM